jgi:hypothetical protein
MDLAKKTANTNSLAKQQQILQQSNKQQLHIAKARYK